MDGSSTYAPSAPAGAGTLGMELETPLIFEQGAPGRSGASLPPREGFPDVDPQALLGAAYREESAHLPEVSEPEAFRHYVRLSRQNFAIDLGMYPLGSCTMKYNPKVNEWAARLPGFAGLHPLAPDSQIQGALELMYRLEQGLAEALTATRGPLAHRRLHRAVRRL